MKTWTPKQKSIYYDLQAGVKPSEIAKNHKLSPCYVTKIKNAIKNGEKPPIDDSKLTVKSTSKGVKTGASSKTDQAQGVAQNTTQTTSPEGNTPGVNETVKVEPPAITTPSSTPAPLPSTIPAAGAPAAREAVAARISIQPVNIALTPTMYNVKSYLVQRLGWSQETPWEDIIDNVFAKYFDSIGIVMRGWYEKAEYGPSRPAYGNDSGPKQSPPPENGNGHKVAAEVEINTESEEFKKLVRMVSKGMVVLAKQNQLGDL